MMVTDADIDGLLIAAREVRAQAYVPYSQFAVGAAVRAEDGTVYTGCNVENASYGLTICAERNAIAHAVAEGARRFDVVAVVTENGVTPCGACRQVLAEFGLNMTVVIEDVQGNRRQYTMRELLPDGFGPEDLR